MLHLDGTETSSVHKHTRLLISALGSTANRKRRAKVPCNYRTINTRLL